MTAPASNTTIRGAAAAFDAAVSDKQGERPKQPTSPFSMRLTADERAFLDEHAGGRPWSAYIRECVFRGKGQKRRAVRRPKVEDKQLVEMLSGLGQSRMSSNMNQLAKSANMGTLDVPQEVEQQLEDACGAILAMRDALFVALGLKPERRG